MKRVLALIFIVFFAALLITFQIKNPGTVPVVYYFGLNYQLPFFVVILVPFVAGLLLGLFFMSLSLFKQKRHLGKAKKDLAKVEQEVKNLRAMPIKDEV